MNRQNRINYLKAGLLFLILLLSTSAFTQEYSCTTTQFSGIDHYMAPLTPAVTDLDGDGLIDLLIGDIEYGEQNSRKHIAHWEQESPGSETFLLRDNPYNSIETEGYSNITLTDIDGNGLLDLIIGVATQTRHGYMVHYQQSSLNSTEFSWVTDRFLGIYTDRDYSYSAPFFIDLDNNDRLDLLIGSYNGKITHYQQNSHNSLDFTLITNEFCGIDVGEWAVPFVIDYNHNYINDNLLDLFIGNGDGEIFHYIQNSQDATSFTLESNAFSDIHMPQNASPCFVDIDKNGDLDLLIGQRRYIQRWERAPVIVTEDISNIGCFSASSGGYDISLDATVNSKGVCWSTSINPTTSDPHTNNGSGDNSFDSSIDNLNLSTTYYVRSYAITNYGTFYGKQKSFTTATTPNLSTSDISNIGAATASGGGYSINDGGTTITGKGVCWSTSQNPTTANSHTNDGTGESNFSSSLTGLVHSTTYFVRAYATNDGGTSYGEEISFETDIPPTLSTSDISTIRATSATCGGYDITDGNNNVSSKGVCWSTSQNPTTANNHTDDGSGTDNYNSSITGLTHSTTYFVRAFATNDADTSYGDEKSFTTSYPPSISTSSIININYSSANCGGNNLNDDGDPITVKGIVWATSQNPTTSSYLGKTTDGNGTDSFASDLTGLTSGQTYYIRAYATNGAGTSYGDNLVFAPNMQPAGNALQFNGSDEYVNCGNNSNLDITSTMTIEAWIKPTEGNSIRSIIGRKVAGNSNPGFAFFINSWNTSDQKLIFETEGYEFKSTNGVITWDEWQHVAFTTDGANNSNRFYLNGEEVATSGFVNFTSATANLIIGALDESSYFYGGSIDEVRVWSSIRTQTEIQNNMNLMLDGTEANLEAYYRFDHLSGTALFDRTTNYNDGTLHNMGNNNWIESLVDLKSDIISTNEVSDILETTATCGGNFSDLGFASMTDKGIVWNIAGNPTTNSNTGITHSGSGNANFVSDCTNLTAGQTYFVKAFATNVDGTTYGEEKSFITDNIAEVQTDSTFTNNTASATIFCEVTADNGANVTTRGICWGLQTNPTIIDNVVQNGAGLGTYDCEMSGLQPDTRYYVKAFATNEVGTSYGEELEFFTPNNLHNMLAFDGINKYISAPITLPEQGTIETWVNLNAVSGSYSIFNASTSENSNWKLNYSSHNGYYLRIGETSYAHFTFNEANSWHHVAITWSKRIVGLTTLVDFYLYLNGNLQDAIVGNSWSEPNPTVFIGKTYDNYQFMDGKLDEYRIWNTVRSAAQIQNNMHEAINPQTPGLLCYYDFDQSSGVLAIDRTGNGNDGTLQNIINSDWRISSAPLGEQGVTVVTNEPTPIGNFGTQMTTTITSTPDTNNYLGIFTSGDGEGHINAETFPAGINQRSDILWGVEEFGTVTADLVFDYSGITIADQNALRLLKRHNSDFDWNDFSATAVHDFSAHTFTLTGQSSFSEFTIADDRDEALPVELSTFTAIQTPENFAQINWTTQSESNLIGYNIYRNLEDDLNTALLMNYDIIESMNSIDEQNYTFTDGTVEIETNYSYWLESIELDGSTSLYGPISFIIADDPESEPTPPFIITGLQQNYPNPFNPITEIKFALAVDGNAELTIFNIKGQKVITLYDELTPANSYITVKWSGKDSQHNEVGSGIFLYRLITSQKKYFKKMILLK